MIFNRDVVAIHNLEIMNKQAFSRLFDEKDLQLSLRLRWCL